MRATEHGLEDTPNEAKPWWFAPRNDVHQTVFTYVQGVERRHAKTFDKFLKLKTLYDPNALYADAAMAGVDILGLVSENVIAGNVDTVHSAIGTTEIRARFQTVDADWSVQRQAVRLEWYVEDLVKLLDVNEKCTDAFKGKTLLGTGLVEVGADRFDQLFVEQVPVEEIVVDEAEVHDGMPKQMHRRVAIDRDELKAEYPQFAEDIDRAQSNDRSWRMWRGYRKIEQNEIAVIKSWRLPVGVKGKKSYRPGRRTIVIDGKTLLDEKWEKPFFPIAVDRWSKPPMGFYGIGLGERLVGHQKVINKMNWQVDKQLDQWAVPTQFVRPVDANLAVKRVDRAGGIAVVKGEIPKTVIGQAVSGEVYNRLERVKSSASEESGVSRMASQGQKPPGLDSGVALREYTAATTQRFAQQEKSFERFVLNVILLLLDCCKDLGKKAPTVTRRTRFGKQQIKWSDVDMKDVKVQIAAASTISRTPAGRVQTVLEWAQAGIVSKDEARRLLQHSDLEAAMSLYTAALENVEHCVEEIFDGNIVMPEPFMNVKMCVWRGQMHYLEARDNGAPEEILEALRQFVVQAAWMVGQQTANDNAAIGAPGAGAATPPLPGEAPTPSSPAVAAFSPQAMQLRATAAG